MILLFHNVGSIEHHCWVVKKRLIEICEKLKPDEVHFDDANINAFDTILALRALGFKIKIFVPVAFMGIWFYSNGYFPIQVMNIRALNLLRNKGVIIGSHSVTHRDMCKLILPVAHSEFLESKRFLEAYFGSVTEFAFPLIVPRKKEIIELGNQVYGVCYGLDQKVSGLVQRFPVSSTHVRINVEEVLIEDLST